ncbi:uncharacterized protein LOC107410922 isoform X1 [Ziziphus jujuba]|uniref:Uncharacterized protein LOC107410922 isoform X1 n=1 Tax=Ziziphus jujuba TaxID=326968 RepID=A0A6P3Z911_ZIZJJ|nr:uncharacterized protein LOC107410922 isoform X1 [Ziziphus jujuba]
MECKGCGGRPNRSDIHLSRGEEAEIEATTRNHFDGITPKRHTKPQRSEYSSKYVDSLSNGAQQCIPEFLEFQRLENHPDQQKLNWDTRDLREEFVETEYYKDLNCADKIHHTTGTGFINIDRTSDKRYNLAPDTVTACHDSCKGNPATNEWIPEPAIDTIPLASGKPHRSDN